MTYVFYVEYDKENIDIVKRGLTFEEARAYYGEYAGRFYKTAGTTWQGNVYFFENEDSEDEWRFEGVDVNENAFCGGFYPEAN